MAQDDSELKSELDRIKEREAEKRLLYDRTVGGKDAPRPSTEFIRQNAGSLRSEKEIAQEARTNLDQQQAVKRQEAQLKASVEQSMREHNRSVEERVQKEAQERAKAVRERMEQAKRQREAQKQTRGRSRS